MMLQSVFKAGEISGEAVVYDEGSVYKLKVEEGKLSKYFYYIGDADAYEGQLKIG